MAKKRAKKTVPFTPAKKAPKKPYGLSDFFIREKSNTGVDVPLPLPNGEDSGHTIRVRGIDSDHFRKAQIQRSRRNMEIIKLPESEREAAFEKVDTDLLVALVAGWTLDVEATPENVSTLLTENPQIRKLVDNSATDRSAFFGKR